VHVHAVLYPAWGHRKIWALTLSRRPPDEHEHGAPDPRAAWTQPPAPLAKARRQTFRDPPGRRNRVRQSDFSEHKTLVGAG
jgi:hypothetical protein